jgi:hypothetical protein
MKVLLSEASGGIRNLAGAAAARSHLKGMRDGLDAMLCEYANPLVLVLDFSDVESVTSSYVKASLIWLIRCGQRSVAADYFEPPGDGATIVSLPAYPVVAHISDEIREELEVVLASEELCCLEVSTEGEPKILGSLERTLRETFRRLVAEEEVTASELHQKFGDGINVTGWNNRLADLHRLRLAWRRKEGRQWTYAPVSKSGEVQADPRQEKCVG